MLNGGGSTLVCAKDCAILIGFPGGEGKKERGIYRVGRRRRCPAPS